MHDRSHGGSDRRNRKKIVVRQVKQIAVSTTFITGGTMNKLSSAFMMVVLSLTLTLDTDACVRLAVKTGNWNTGSTWLGGEVPSACDEVIIASDAQVTVDAADAACLSILLGNPIPGGGAGILAFAPGSHLTVTGPVVLCSCPLTASQYGAITMTSGGTLSCGGLVSLSPNDVWTPGTGTVELTGANTLPDHSFLTFNNLTVNGGTTTLGTGITIEGTLTLTKGNINTTASKMLTLGAGAAVAGGGSASFVNGPMRQTWTSTAASKIFPLGKTTYEPLTIALVSPASAVIQAECFNGDACGCAAAPITKLSSAHYYQAHVVSGTAGTGGSVTLPNDNEFMTIAPALVVAQSTALAGTYAPLHGNTGTALSVTSPGYDPAAGSFLVLGTTDSALPVELTSFTASPSKGAIVLRWATVTEQNNAGFEVQRRSLSGPWMKLGYVDGSGSSNVQHSYAFTDAATAGTYSYRLKQIDRDGAYTFSNEVEAVSALTADEYTVSQNYPNPFNPSTTIRFAVHTTQNVSVKVFNTIGQEVADLFNGIVEAGVMTSVRFDASGLASGTYIYQLHTPEKTEVRRMLLVR
jgi:hypothetical protein